MNKLIFLAVLLFSSIAQSGSLYTFDESEIVMSTLSHVQKRYSDLSQVELKPEQVRPQINKSGKLIISSFFSYKAANEFGLLYVCVNINENGELLNIKRDIGARKSMNMFVLPEEQWC
jgi:hypothetical protein